jgi:hypothetical protein
MSAICPRQTIGLFVGPCPTAVIHGKAGLSGPYPGYGLGALDAFDGYVSYRMLDEKALSGEIADMRRLIDQSAPSLVITQDLGLGMMLWMTQFFPEEPWAQLQRKRCLVVLDHMWREEGYFCREPDLPNTKFAFTNYGVSIGLQAAAAMPERVERLKNFLRATVRATSMIARPSRT